MTDEDDRRAITAVQRLFAGTPLRSSGTLDIVTLAQESGVKRNKLTHKHTDLKDLFYAQRRTRDGVPDNEVKRREQIAALHQTNQSLRDDTSAAASPLHCTDRSVRRALDRPLAGCPLRSMGLVFLS